MKEETNPHYSQEGYLLPAGPIPLSLFNAHRLLVEPFPISDRRSHLWNELIGYANIWETDFKVCGFELWIDGCFATQQPSPHTIFVLLILRREALQKSAIAKKYFYALEKADKEIMPALHIMQDDIENLFSCNLHVLLYTDDPKDSEYETCQAQLERWKAIMSHYGQRGFIVLKIGKGLTHEE